MASPGSILIADDDEACRESISWLLQPEGFDCHCVRDTEEAVACLRKNRFDLLVTDICMPDNQDLHIVREARRIDDRMGVILVTGQPSMETAITSIELSISAYLTKPVDDEELVRHVHTSISYSRNQRALAGIRRRLGSCLADLEAIESRRLRQEARSEAVVSMATVRTLASCLSELLDLRSRSRQNQGCQNLCELLDCPQQPVHRKAIVTTIEVLRKTKENIKSKALAELRTRLEKLV